MFQLSLSLHLHLSDYMNIQHLQGKKYQTGLGLMPWSCQFYLIFGPHLLEFPADFLRGG